MIFNGISKTYSTIGNRQFSSIGRFWDKMAAKYGRENLRGLGYNWTDTTIEYVIGLRKGTIPEANCNVELPDIGWTCREGRTDELNIIYSLIYMDGPLKYEIETFDETGEFVDIQYIRDTDE